MKEEEIMQDISLYNPGVDLIEAIRLNMPDTPVILVTPSDSPYKQGMGETKIRDLSDIYGHDNYVLFTIPSSTNRGSLFTRFYSRLKHLLMKRDTDASSASASDSVSGSSNGRIRIKDLQINLATHEVFRSGKPVKLTLTEFNLLVAMATNDGDILDYLTLVRTVLGYEAEKAEAKELIKRHIYALRRKLEPTPGNSGYILNVRGVGYRMAVA
jgi:DNA-binding winged helix-turn-helix (wHTH) protein